MRSGQAANDVCALLRARNTLIWVNSAEEVRVEGYLVEAAKSAGYVPRFWDCAQGVTDIAGRSCDYGDADPDSMLRFIDVRGRGSERGVWIMRDLAPWLTAPIGMVALRRLRNLQRSLSRLPREGAQSIIVLASNAPLPAELSGGQATVIDWPMPDKEEIGSLLDAAIKPLEGRIKPVDPNSREAIIDSALGLSGEEAQSCFARSAVLTNSIDPQLVATEKKRVIAREKVIEWIDPLPGGLEAVGGLDCLKAWLDSRRVAYTPRARAFGLPSPKGALLVGVQGCGKSMTAKAVSTAWGVPLLRLDLGALKSKFVGDSEANVRRVFRVIEAVGRCVVWIDEIEKALAGATDGSADGGVSSDALGAFLSWTQERQGEAFLLATSNDVSKLPPELLRKGRFDELWFVDLPTRSERADIVISAMRAHNRRDAAVDFVSVADATAGFIGAEIASLVPEALFAAFDDGEREITTADLIAAAKLVVPLSKTAAGKIQALRDWAQGKARPATTPETEATGLGARQIDL